MQDYTYACLATLPRDELINLSQRLLHRLVPESSVNELFRFDPEEASDEEARQALHFDALLRMHAIALSDIPALFSQSQQPEQNIERMTRLVLWHFYALAFHLEQAISLRLHCDKVEALLANRPRETYQWVNSLTHLLQEYATSANQR